MRDAPSDSTTVFTIVYLARLREAFETSNESMPLSAGEMTVADMLARLRARGGTWATELAEGRAVRVAVNHAMVAPTSRIRAGDEVALLPPVTGG